MWSDETVGPLASWPVASRNGVCFWLFSTLVRIRYTFLIVAIVIAGSGGRDLTGILGWILVVTLGVLLHEFGHVAAARYHRFTPSVELHTMGGVTRWKTYVPMAWYEQVSISLAGPAMGFLAGALLYASMRLSGVAPMTPLLWQFVADFMWINVAWGTFNLLPMFPLDGAQAMEALLAHYALVQDPRRTMRMVSLITGVSVAILAFAAGFRWAALLAALFAYDSAQRMRGARSVADFG
jgi:Zn-dependent protease